MSDKPTEKLYVGWLEKPAVPAQSAPTPVPSFHDLYTKDADGFYVRNEKPIPSTSAPFKDGGLAAPTENADYIRGWNEAIDAAAKMLEEHAGVSRSEELDAAADMVRTLAEESK